MEKTPETVWFHQGRGQGTITLNLLAISYRAIAPQRAKNILDALLTIFAERTAGSSRKEMDRAQQFLDGEIALYQEKLRAADQRRADLNRQYADQLPLDKFVTRVEQAKAGIKQLEIELSDAIANRDSLRKATRFGPADAQCRSRTPGYRRGFAGDRCRAEYNASNQAWILNALANAYSLSGQPHRAVPVFQNAILFAKKRDNLTNLAIALGEL